MIAKYMANIPEPSYPVTVTDISLQDWTPTIEAIGFIEPSQGVTLTTEASGVIDSIKFESGEKAEKGQVLLTLDSTVEQATLKAHRHDCLRQKPSSNGIKVCLNGDLCRRKLMMRHKPRTFHCPLILRAWKRRLHAGRLKHHLPVRLVSGMFTSGNICNQEQALCG